MQRIRSLILGVLAAFLVSSSAADPGLVPETLPAIVLANGGMFDSSHVDLLCGTATHHDPQLFKAALVAFFGDATTAKARELFGAAYPYVRCEDTRRNLVMQVSYGNNSSTVLYLLKTWKPLLNIYRTTDGKTELDYILADAHQMKQRQGTTDFTSHWQIYRYLKHPRLHEAGQEGRFACQIDKTCDCSDDPEDFGRSCGKWTGAISP